MGHVFRRSSGRGWRLRRRSMELWPLWVKELSWPDEPLLLQTPLVQLATTDEEAALQRKLVEERSHLGLSFITADRLALEHPDWPKSSHGGLQSNHDGRLDPLILQRSLRRELHRLSVPMQTGAVETLHRDGNQWQLELSDGSRTYADTVVVCSGLASQTLLAPLGHARAMDPVLGQVLQLKLRNPDALNPHWPAVLMSHGVNLIRHGSDQLLLGATLEPGEEPLEAATLTMRALNGHAPTWLEQAEVIGHWHGLRARPSGRPAPLLEKLEPGLILASGHYRNGVLLAPATAEWVSKEIDGETSKA